MSTHEAAPATNLVATHCAVCGRPLVDAKSCETGIGPICAQRFGFDLPVSEEARKEANALVYRIAAHQHAPESIIAIERLRAIGFAVLADRIAERIKAKPEERVTITVDGGCIAVEAPFREAAVPVLRAVPGRRFDRATNRNVFPASSKAAVWEALKATYAGMLAVGPKGMFVIGAGA